MPKVSEGGGVDFLLSTFCVIQSALPLSKSLLCITLVACWCVSYDNGFRIACLLPSLTTQHYYFVLILRVAATADLDDEGRLVERGIYTDYVIVSKETRLGIATLEGMVHGKRVRGRRRYQMIHNITINQWWPTHGTRATSGTRLLSKWHTKSLLYKCTWPGIDHFLEISSSISVSCPTDMALRYRCWFGSTCIMWKNNFHHEPGKK